LPSECEYHNASMANLSLCISYRGGTGGLSSRKRGMEENQKQPRHRL